MAYVPFTNDYSSIRTPAVVAAELARRTAIQSRVNDAIVGGNAVMGGLMSQCCNDPQFAGQGFYDDSIPAGLMSLPAAGSIPVGGSGGGGLAVGPSVSGLPVAGVDYSLTPVDILTGTFGFPMRRDGRMWQRPQLPDSTRRALALSYPNFLMSGLEASKLVPPCPCFAAPAPVPIASPVVVRTDIPPAPTVRDDSPASEAIRLAKWRATLPGGSGLGQIDTSGIGGMLAVVAGAGILLWAMKK